VTITYPVINAARRVWILASGAGKAGMVAEVLEGLMVPDAIPAQGVRPVHGKLTWLLDEAAAGELSEDLTAAVRNT
jgi:6-phosphogluconolactonase